MVSAPDDGGLTRKYSMGTTVAATEQSFIPVENVISFLTKTLPFNLLEADILRRLAGKCVIDFFPAGTMIFLQDVTKRHTLK